MTCGVLIDRDVRALLLFLAPWTAACALVFLVASSFFTAWDGTAVSMRRPPGLRSEEAPKVWQVLIVGEEGGATEVGWPDEVVSGLALPVDSLAIPPNDLPPERPATRKSRYSLHFLVDRPGVGWVTVPTTSPRSLGVALVLLLLGTGARNMVWAGSPIAIHKAPLLLPEALPTAGTPAEPNRGPGSRRQTKNKPPPPRPKRGPRR